MLSPGQVEAGLDMVVGTRRAIGDGEEYRPGHVLGNKVLARDATQRVTLNGYRSPIFDIKLVDTDGDTYTYWKVDVSKRDIVARPEHLDRR